MNKLTYCFFTFAFSLLTISAFAQQPCKETLFTIGNENVSCQEFLDTYLKNAMNKPADMSESALRDYLNLYINFRLKVKEAKEMHIDTITSVKTELNTYRSQLAKTYLTDTATLSRIARDAYDRLLKQVRVSHILVKCDPNASAADTMKARKKITAIRNMIMKGKDFAQVAKDSSDDGSAKDNGGDLGYITSMQVEHHFEKVAYNTSVGKISDPFRTRFGYHILKVTDVKPNPGTVQVEHIFVKIPKNATDEEKEKAKAKIDEVYGKLKDGDNFEDLAKQYSEDKTSAGDGGRLAAFGAGKMLPEFEEAAFGLQKPNDYSAPVQTKVGWHIIKLLERKPIAPYNDMKDNLRKQIEKDPRAEEAKISFITNLKKMYNLQESTGNKNVMLMGMDSSFIKGLWTADELKNPNDVLFTLTDNTYNVGSKNFTAKDFAAFIEKNQRKYMNAGDKTMMFGKMYDQFLENSIVGFEEERLAAKYPPFKNLMGEYSDGILLFELTDQKVWSKAVKDSTGLKAFYETVKGNNMSNEKAKVSTYICANQTVADDVLKMLDKSTSDAKILDKVNKKNATNLKIDYSVVEKGKASDVENKGWEKNKNYVISTENGIKILRITEFLAPSPKLLEEVRGFVVADYQEKLEREWIQSLRQKYPVKINDAVLMGLVK